MPRSTSPIVLLGVSGSLRGGSANTALLRTAAELAPDDVEVVVHPLRGLPFYDADLERAHGFPAPVQDLRTAMAQAEGLLLATPEYNWSITAVLKNAIDWASRGPDSPLDRKPAALMSAAGRSGGSRAQRHLRDILGHNQVDVLDTAVQIPLGQQHVADGRLVTGEHRDAVAALVVELRDRVLERRAQSAAA
jgi:chromate reductase, NAD(P)H dehydrogenase (quinone)